MLALEHSCRYYLYRSDTDMRKGFDSLCGLVQHELNLNPLSGDIFIFLNRRRDRIKLLVWDQNGYAIYYKRLEQGTYEIPEEDVPSKSIYITREKLMLIMEGIELKTVRKRKRFSLQKSV